ncbi:FeoA family protein [Sporanaerobacter acetigenes]|uniref:Ferrous iron transport protein A n=1 Tax=Sporanaerobacter acetigenes DSM 13106 TaxID=1123281 RepID=A0A1M5VTP3_9FIRM|nr:FeoA family protein [Sporanaerobacter acetigenes]SHH78558.1 ferrous iron transport protein A [Sporanaerobacter acetigenes DSM 13106]
MPSLNEMPLGSKIKVKELSKEASVRKRLLEMGVVPGIEVEVVGKAPLGDPIEIIVRGYKLTLRKDEAANIFVE